MVFFFFFYAAALRAFSPKVLLRGRAVRGGFTKQLYNDYIRLYYNTIISCCAYGCRVVLLVVLFTSIMLNLFMKWNIQSLWSDTSGVHSRHFRFGAIFFLLELAHVILFLIKNTVSRTVFNSEQNKVNRILFSLVGWGHRFSSVQFLFLVGRGTMI